MDGVHEANSAPSRELVDGLSTGSGRTWSSSPLAEGVQGPRHRLVGAEIAIDWVSAEGIGVSC